MRLVLIALLCIYRNKYGSRSLALLHDFPLSCKNSSGLVAFVLFLLMQLSVYGEVHFKSLKTWCARSCRMTTGLIPPLGSI